jgi:hypothetical protein
MQQRRPRLGDILDDYCPRERRVTNHAVVAMIEDEVKQTRCTTCDAEHEYKQAKVPASRRRRPEDPAGDIAAAASSLARMSEPSTDESLDDMLPEPLTDDSAPLDADGEVTVSEITASEETSDADLEGTDDEGPVHRRLIRATLPRPEGQSPERKAPDFTARQPSRFDQRNGQRHRGRQARQGGQQSFGQPARPGGQRHGSGSASGRQGGNDAGGERQRNGNRAGNTSGQRGGRPFGANRGPRQGGGQGRKRGR